MLYGPFPFVFFTLPSREGEIGDVRPGGPVFVVRSHGINFARLVDPLNDGQTTAHAIALDPDP
jgi:hypothetical protein